MLGTVGRDKLRDGSGFVKIATTRLAKAVRLAHASRAWAARQRGAAHGHVAACQGERCGACHPSGRGGLAHLNQRTPEAAGLFSWLGGRRRPEPKPAAGAAWNHRRHPAGDRGGAQGQGGAPQAGSGAFHGDELPPDEGNAATREWITNPALGTPTLSPQNIEATKAAIQRYEAIVAQGGWPAVPAYAMRPGSTGQEVVTLHRRLEISGDLVGKSIPDEYDAALAAAVKKFQSRHGMPPTGAIDRITVDAMNVPATIRLRQLQANLSRLQTLAPAAAPNYVVVNIPAAQVEAVEGAGAQRHAAVVGKPERPTPELSSKIQEINFNPYWYVPKSIIYKDLVPKAREFAKRNQDMLAAYHMEAFDAAGNPLDPRQIDWFGNEVYNYNFRQLPWEENSLGFVKINFPNKDAVYMHDTPLKSLFGRNVRFESSGCVRCTMSSSWWLGSCAIRRAGTCSTSSP